MVGIRKLKTEKYKGFTIKFEQSSFQLRYTQKTFVTKAIIYGNNNVYLYTITDITKKRAFDNAKFWIRSFILSQI